MALQGDVWVMNPNSHILTRKFKDEYDLKEELGKGGFGVVRRCVWKRDKSEYAVKMNNTPDKKRSMDEERDICKALCTPTGHVNIINLFDSIEESTTIFNVYELATGGDLMEDIISREYYSERDASDVFAQLIHGLDFIHGKRYLHRDLKPHNLLLKRKKSNIIKITDFGLVAKRRSDPPDSKNYVLHAHGGAGTPAYYSPEVSRNQPYDTDCDMFSCGVILYQLISGYLPFWDDDANVAKTNLQNINFEYPSPEWDGLDAAKDLISKLLCPVSRRLTCAGVLAHQFIANRAESTSTEHRPETINAFEQFQRNRHRKAQLLKTYWESRHTSGSGSGEPSSEPSGSGSQSTGTKRKNQEAPN